MRRQGESFAEVLDKHIRPKARERLQWHLKQKHCCLLISASIDVYLEPWAKKMGCHQVISSQIEISPEGLVTGQLSGLNCRGLEKVRRLHEWLGRRQEYCLYAYGDSRGDKELLDDADHSYYRQMPEKDEG
jgi:HAD superfamily hydrolase (TIGR01490 family)